MTPRSSGSLAAAVVMLAALPYPALAQRGALPTAAGCPLEPAKFHECAVPKMNGFDPPKTPDGHPDMQGYWERAFTSQDVEEHGADGLNTQAGPSLVVDPPDRKIPYQPWAAEFRKGIVQKFISPLASCLPPGIPRDIIAPGAHQIVQTPGYVMHLLEYSHSYRIIETGGNQHIADTVRLWQGNSRGRWEGNTLVVDVRNTNGLAWLDNAGNFVSDALHVVERLTMVDSDTIHYEARLEDPKVYTRAWTMVSALVRNKERGFEVWEQACHEGNHAVDAQRELGMTPFLGASPR